MTDISLNEAIRRFDEERKEGGRKLAESQLKEKEQFLKENPKANPKYIGQHTTKFHDQVDYFK